MPDDVTQLRLVVTTPDYDAALAFYRDVLGLPTEAAFESPDGRVTILAAGRATLELADPAQADFIDEVEVGERVAGPLRVAFEVTGTAAVTDRLARAGARVVAPPTLTPWSSLNARLDTPGGLHVTLFQNDADESAPRTEGEIMAGRVGLVPDRVDAPVLLTEPDPSWPATAAALVADIERALGDRVLLLAHVGSTSVPGLAAKPLIDLVLAVRHPVDEDDYVGGLEGLGRAVFPTLLRKHLSAPAALPFEAPRPLHPGQKARIVPAGEATHPSGPVQRRNEVADERAVLRKRRRRYVHQACV